MGALFRELEYCRNTLLDVQRGVLRKLISLRVFWNCTPENVQRYSLITAQDRYRTNPAEGSGNAREVFLTFQQVPPPSPPQPLNPSLSTPHAISSFFTWTVMDTLSQLPMAHHPTGHLSGINN